MNISIKRYQEEMLMETSKMLTDLMNYHRKLTNAPKEFWQKDEESRETIISWNLKGEIYNIYFEDSLAGFFYMKVGGQNVAWLEDICIKEEFRGRGIGKEVMKLLDDMLQRRGIITSFVNVIPRNIKAISFYKECGFDHLNMIELRKNYDEKLNKEEEINILGFEFKKY